MPAWCTLTTGQRGSHTGHYVVSKYHQRTSKAHAKVLQNLIAQKGIRMYLAPVRNVQATELAIPPLWGLVLLL